MKHEPKKDLISRKKQEHEKNMLKDMNIFANSFFYCSNASILWEALKEPRDALKQALMHMMRT